eukprot:5710074-Alexandrium_andersonii.AAC.1
MALPESAYLRVTGPNGPSSPSRLMPHVTRLCKPTTVSMPDRPCIINVTTQCGGKPRLLALRPRASADNWFRVFPHP